MLCYTPLIIPPLQTLFLSILTFIIKFQKFYFPWPSWILDINLFKQKQNYETPSDNLC